MNETLRRVLLAIFVLGVAGISGELLLMGHHEDFYQQIPLGLAALSLAAAGAVLRKPGRGTINLDMREQRPQTVRRIHIGEARAMRSKLAKERITVPFDALANDGDAKSRRCGRLFGKGSENRLQIGF